ncbi:hypothetical protein TNCV_4962271 [Trichonephila clavipes]|nr:hypothetical protein TNCV_4962271 [Trichonephila clavipes]
MIMEGEDECKGSAGSDDTSRVFIFKQLCPEMPSCPDDEQEKLGEGRKKVNKNFNPCAKGHTTQMTTSQARQGREKPMELLHCRSRPGLLAACQ